MQICVSAEKCETISRTLPVTLHSVLENFDYTPQRNRIAAKIEPFRVIVAMIVGSNEETLCDHPRPSLSSVQMGYERIGYEAAR
jgi:hypothetical protein